MRNGVPSAMELLRELDDTFLVLADSVPKAGRQLAACTGLLGEIRGMVGVGQVDARLTAVIARFKEIADNLAQCLEIEPTAGPKHKNLLADLLELRPTSEEGHYPTAAIDEIRQQARVLLIEK